MRANYTGKKFGKLTIIGYAKDFEDGSAKVICECECGGSWTGRLGALQGKRKVHCGATLHKDPSKLPINMVGHIIGDLIVIERVDKGDKKSYWRLRCACGNEIITSHASLIKRITLHCGCKSANNKQDLTGRDFGGFVALRRGEMTSYKHYTWVCECNKCGKEFVSLAENILKGLVTGCGCRRIVDMVGKKFGKLTVISFAGSHKNKALWLCRCECGHEVIVPGMHMRQGLTLSCGCLRSVGENIIESILTNNNISFVREKKFIGCKNINSLLFDFFLPDYGICIEFDGPQHYIQLGKWGNNKLEITQKRDAIKTAYCEENDIVLLRIPYTKMRNISEIFIEWGIILAADTATSTAA